MKTRPTVVTAAVAAAAALAATGITYASASAYEPAQAAPAVQQAAAPAAAPLGGESGKENEGREFEGKGHEEREFEGRGFEEKEFEGRIHINERSYSAHPGGCVTIVSGLGSRSLNIRNDSWRTVEVFRGATCDNGAPIATVGPHSSSDGVHPGHVRGGVFVKNGVVGSFRVVHHFGKHGGNEGFGGRGGNNGFGGHGGR